MIFNFTIQQAFDPEETGKTLDRVMKRYGANRGLTYAPFTP
jgi:hypothetical protein